MIQRIQGGAPIMPKTQEVAKKTVYDRPPLKPMPSHVTERLNPDAHFHSLSTPIDILRENLTRERVAKIVKLPGE